MRCGRGSTEEGRSLCVAAASGAAASAMDSFCSCGSILHQQLYFSIPIGAETALMASEDGKERRRGERTRSLGEEDRVRPLT